MKKIGLVLSGGMAKGAYQIGVLKALAQYYKPNELTAVSAASIGALNGYAFLSGQLAVAEQMWQELAGQKRTFIGHFMKEQYLNEITKALTCASVPLACPFYLALMNVTELGLVYADLSKVPLEQCRDFLKASVSMPGFSRSVKLNGRKFFDGAVIDNIPVYPLAEVELDCLICVYFDGHNYIFENTQMDRTIIKITFPPQGRISPSLLLDRQTVQEMIQQGYDYANSLFSVMFHCGADSFSELQKRMSHAGTGKKQELRITGDVVVGNINRIAQKIAKRSRLFD